jgi:Alkyl sulfatase C-terminal
MDTGNNVGMGREVLSMIHKVSDKPIVEEGGGKNVTIFGHPALDRYLQSTVGALGPMQFRRVAIQLGLYLPDQGADAAYAIPEPHFDDPALNVSGHVPVNRPVKDGEEVVIDGRKVVKITFNDVNKSYGLALRRGVSEFLANAPDTSDLEVTLPLTEWAAIATGGATLGKAASEGKAKLSRDPNALAAVIASFDPITAPKEDPNIDARNY